MTEEILINVTPQETRAAMVQNGMLQELHIERIRSKGIVGNIYLGVVKRILPGMQAAFVDIGLERAAFIHAQDLMPRDGQAVQYQQHDPQVQITSLLSEGRNILVQVIKDPIGSKGARLTAQISIAMRNVVLLPKEAYIGISQRIQGNEKRSELLQQLRERVDAADRPGGYILRTVGEFATPEAVDAEMNILNRTWESIAARIENSRAPMLIHQNLPLATRLIRDLDWNNVERVRIDSRETCNGIRDFVRHLIPQATERIEHYPGDRPIFDLYGIEEEIQKALNRKIPLKSGGYLVIDQTEALTSVDVNTGSFTGKRNLEETIFRTNLEAVTALARQIRLRNLCGIIVVDFIDMSLHEHSEQVMRMLRRELQRDPCRTSVSEMTSLSLVEITRKRSRDSLLHVLTQPCPTCQGRGTLKSPHTVCYEIFREIMRTSKEFSASSFLVTASPKVVDLLMEEEASGVSDLESFIRASITLQVDPLLDPEQYEVVFS
ncbi:MAG: ribonuclease G [Gammaproteobacteria bacterium]|nr:ribonuclease G [Gammaproteobacteria bacterium]